MNNFENKHRIDWNNKKDVSKYCKEWRKNNKEKIKEYRKKQREKIGYKQWRKEWRKVYRNKPEVKEKERIRRIKGKEWIDNYCKINRNSLNIYGVEYYKRNKEKVKKYQKKYQREKYRNNPNYNIGIRLRRRVWGAFDNYSKTGKIRTSKEYGIDYGKIIEHLKPFQININRYHVDHIKPLCSFDLSKPSQIKEAFLPENHQWLLAKENIRKGGKVIVTSSSPSSHTHVVQT